jgi:hypothetical protein
MWQAPALTLVAQAFLLTVLTAENVDQGVRRAVLIAGLTAIFAAFVALVRLRSREVLYAEAIAAWSDKLDIPDVRPYHLQREKLRAHGPFHYPDAFVRWVAGWNVWPPGYWLWLIALAAFAAADAVAFSHRP